MKIFFQSRPELGNQYTNDILLQKYLKRLLHKDIHAEIEPGLVALGQRTITEILPLGRTAEASPPQHIPFDAWGNRIDEIQVSPAWKELERISVEERLVSLAYDRPEGEYSRIHQFARVYLYGPSSAIFTCPLAMTDGAARCLQLYGNTDHQKRAFQHLVSRTPDDFWTSGQWMTEKTGGSDVGMTSTVARKTSHGYELSGTKWFTSATTSQMAMTLARPEGAPEGSRGLSLFFLETQNSENRLNGIEIHRLKNKLGTRALPTAELTLNGTPAQLVGDLGSGVKKISSLFNITRIWNACCAIGYMRRGIALLKDYGTRRIAFGKPICEHPLFRATLNEIEQDFQMCFLLTFRAIELLGKVECNQATENEVLLLRILTPIVKLFTAKRAISVCSEVIEGFGGAGYIEDTGLPQLLKDTQVLAIWEGTTNVLSLDVLRAIQKENALTPLIQDIQEKLKKVQSPQLQDKVRSISNQLSSFVSNVNSWKNMNYDEIEAGARTFSFRTASLYGSVLELEQLDWEAKS